MHFCVIAAGCHGMRCSWINQSIVRNISEEYCISNNRSHNCVCKAGTYGPDCQLGRLEPLSAGKLQLICMLIKSHCEMLQHSSVSGWYINLLIINFTPSLVLDPRNTAAVLFPGKYNLSD